MEIITPDQAKVLINDRDAHKIEEFNKLVKDAIANRRNEIILPCIQWGYDWIDIKFIESAGWRINQDRACRKWHVSLEFE